MEKESCFNELSNPQLELAYDLIENTGVNLFLTGKAGTGKTTFLKKLQRQSYKRMIIVAPTGVAAINAGGATIHSFFQLDLGPFIPDTSIQRKEEPYKFGKDKINIIKSLDLLVIDEISMVRADLLDAVDFVLKRLRRNRLPFGGVQLLMIGDIQQLPPVVKDEDLRVLSPYYPSLFFFHSIALKQTNYACIELKHIFRQSDQAFIDILNKIRENNIDNETLQMLNERVCPNFKPKSEDNYIILTTHNNQAKNINDKRLTDLKGKKHIYKATVSGNFPKMAYPTEETLELKEGAQVMFIKNDPTPEKRFYNGKIGIVHRLDGEKIEVKLDNIEQPITVEPMDWESKKYTIDKTSKEIKEEIEGVFTQYPLRLAWAITIHKSQGLTFDKVIVDAGMAFAHGQVYVALSRCKTLDGLVLSSQIGSGSLFSNHEITQFNKVAESKTPCTEEVEKMRSEYYHMLLNELFNFTQLTAGMANLNRVMDEFFYSLYPDFVQKTKEAAATLKKDAENVANKFVHQINQIGTANIESDENLQNRIKNGAKYLLGVIEPLISPILEQRVESDSQEAMKRYDNAFTYLNAEYKMKVATLRQAQSGFSTKTYIESKSKSLIDISAGSKRKSQTEKVTSNDIRYPDLYNAIRKWRAELAAEMDVPAYTILQQQALIAISNICPKDQKTLQVIKGVGKVTLQKYGDDLLKMTNNESLTANVQEKTPEKEQEQQPEEDKPDTKRVTLEMYRQVKDIELIAQKRGLAASTITKHLTYFIESGALNAEDFVSSQTINKVRKIVAANPDVTRSECKVALGNKVSWDELNFAFAALNREGLFDN